MALLFLTSCSTANIPSMDQSSDLSKEDSGETSQKAYSAMILPGVVDGVFKDSMIYPEIEEKEVKTEDSEKSKIRIGVCEVDGYQTKIMYSGRAIIDEYRSENEEYIYQIERDGNSFSVQAQNSAILQEFLYEKLSEEALLKQIKDYILFYVPDAQLQNYTLSCDTRIIIQGPDSAWGDNKNFFYLADKEANETVLYYAYEFRMFNQELKTPDCITVRCDENGNILSIAYHDYGIDWDTVNIDMTSIRERTNTFISGAISDGYALKDCTFSSESLDFFDSKIRVTIRCELTLMYNGAEIVVLCPVMITP